MTVKKITLWMISLGVALAFLAPLLWMLFASFRQEGFIFQIDFPSWLSGEGWTWTNYADAWRRGNLSLTLPVSLFQVAAIIALGLCVNTTAAYAFARIHFAGREFVFGAVVMLIILPVEVIAVPLFFTARDLGLTGEIGPALAGLTLPFAAKAFNIYFLRQHFLALPQALEEAAVIDGAGPWQQFWNVALPSVKPALATVILLDVLTHWGDFLWPLMIGSREETRTVQIGLANLFTQPPLQWGAIMACAVLATLPVMLLFRLFQRFIVGNETGAGIK